MDRYFQTFQTQKERTKWINQMQKDNPKFRVCFCEPTNSSDKKLFEASGVNTNIMKYACIYTFEHNEERMCV